MKARAIFARCPNWINEAVGIAGGFFDLKTD